MSWGHASEQKCRKDIRIPRKYDMESKDMNEYRNGQGDQRKLVEQLVSVDRIAFNVSQTVVVTTEDKIRLALDSYLKDAKRRTEWIAPLGLLVAVLAALITATFNDFILSAATWRAIFVLVGIGSFIWLVWGLLAIRKNATIDELIDELKAESKRSDSETVDGIDGK